MQEVILVLGSRPITLFEVLAAAGGVFALLLVLLLWQMTRLAGARALEDAAAAERQRELDDKVEAMNRLQAEMTGRMQTLAEVFGSRQADLARLMAERLDSVRTSMTTTLTDTAQKSAESLGKLNERLAVIDAAQSDLKGLTTEVLGLRDILANKQARGAYGQGRMEAIIRDALPSSIYEFQATLSNRSRPDCIIRLPGDDRPLVIDSKFPLEAFVALREAQSDEARQQIGRRARSDLLTHVDAISSKYLVPGETQDIALMFVPSEAIYAELAEKFEEVVQKAYRARVLIVSPSILMMAVQVALSIARDAAVREQARVIQSEMGKLVEDVRRLAERSAKLDQHFRLVQEDVGGIATSADKVLRRGKKIEALDFETAPRVVASGPDDLPSLPLMRQNG